ncbi:hypothetical protein IWX50DRAFT_613016 [Phyllosticta citricarpa]|uniref:Uncharacterized protein n=1 Tax=Phyllosticta citricarpa TaxID=55181 RepID=A0ABR1MT46_9PEZI
MRIARGWLALCVCDRKSLVVEWGIMVSESGGVFLGCGAWESPSQKQEDAKRSADQIARGNRSGRVEKTRKAEEDLTTFFLFNVTLWTQPTFGTSHDADYLFGLGIAAHWKLTGMLSSRSGSSQSSMGWQKMPGEGHACKRDLASTKKSKSGESWMGTRRAGQNSAPGFGLRAGTRPCTCRVPGAEAGLEAAVGVSVGLGAERVAI